MHGYEVAHELQIPGLELHTEGDTWSLGQRVEIHEAGNLVRGEPGHLGEAHGRHGPAGPDSRREGSPEVAVERLHVPPG